MSGPVSPHEIMLRRSRQEPERPIIDAAAAEIRGMSVWNADATAFCVLRSACPKEPPAGWGRALKAALKYRLPPWIDDADVLAAWQAQPLWLELYGNKE